MIEFRQTLLDRAAIPTLGLVHDLCVAMAIVIAGLLCLLEEVLCKLFALIAGHFSKGPRNPRSSSLHGA